MWSHSCTVTLCVGVGWCFSCLVFNPCYLNPEKIYAGGAKIAVAVILLSKFYSTSDKNKSLFTFLHRLYCTCSIKEIHNSLAQIRHDVRDRQTDRNCCIQLASCIGVTTFVQESNCVGDTCARVSAWVCTGILGGGD